MAGPSRRREVEEGDDDDDDDVVYLPSPPAHLRRNTNQDNPIVLSSDSEADSEAAGDEEEDQLDGSDAEPGESSTAPRRASRQPRKKRKTAVRHPEPEEPADKFMEVVFSDDEVVHLPLGWGGLGVARAPVAGPSRALDGEGGNAEAGPSRKRKRSDTASTSAASTTALVGRGRKSKSKSKSKERSKEASPEDPFAYLTEPPTDGTLEAADLLPRVLEILPDLDPDWALVTLRTHIAEGRKGSVVEATMQTALEMNSYPKMKKTTSPSGKGKEKDADVYKSITYRKSQRTGWKYSLYTASALADLFPTIPVPHIRATAETKTPLLVPAYFMLLKDSLEDPKPYTELKRGRMINNLAKEKAKADATLTPTSSASARVTAAGPIQPIRPYHPVQPFAVLLAGGSGASASESWDEGDGGDAEFWKEKEWLDHYIADQQAVKDAKRAKEVAREEALANGHGVDCGCCFGQEILDDMFQCPEGHLFCRDCVTAYVEGKLAEERHLITCMDMSACTVPFSEKELARLLSEKSLQLYYRLRQASEIAAAEIEGLESCPFCPFAAIIENENDKVFRCMNPECKMVSCRKCKEKDHIPKSCEGESESLSPPVIAWDFLGTPTHDAEHATDMKADRRHVVEDAMSEALIRKCPSCKRPYLKDSGCNKIHCSKCGVLSCYICQQVVTGYEHFDQGSGGRPHPPTPGSSSTPTRKKCILWDKQEAEHDQQAVVAARDAAQERVRREAAEEGLELADADLEVAAPAVQAPLAGHGLPVPHGIPGLVVPHVLPIPVQFLGRPGRNAPAEEVERWQQHERRAQQQLQAQNAELLAMQQRMFAQARVAAAAVRQMPRQR